MNSDDGGISPSDQQQSAAEIARKKVLAAYSSTVDTINHLPSDSREKLFNKNAPSINPPTPSPESPYQSTVYQSSEPYWSNSAYQSTDTSTQGIYTPSTTSYDQNSSYTQPSTYSNTPTTDSYTPVSDNTPTPSDHDTSALKDVAISQDAINAEWSKYHSAWQDYYKKYYSNYYAKAAQSYIATEKMKNERIATGKIHRARNLRRLIPVAVVILVILAGLFLQYNRLIFAPIMAYVSPNTNPVASSIDAVDPTITQTVSPEPRLIIPKLNVDVPVDFNVPSSSIDDAMNQGVARFAIPGANALPGQIGNLAIAGHSAGDIYSSNQYKFIFSGLERLENGDLIYINYDSVRYTYQMTKHDVVEPTDVASLVYTTDKPMLTLITCTPLGTSRYRLLITAEQINPNPSGESSEEPTVSEDTEPTPEATMPANEPSFFEKIWQGIFGS